MKPKIIKTDRCKPLRNQIISIDGEIAFCEEIIREGDPRRTAAARRRIVMLKALRRTVQAGLTRCELIPDGPPTDR